MQIGLFTQILLPKHFYIYFVVFVFLTAVVVAVVVAATCGKVFVVHIHGACFMPSLRNRFPQAATKSGNLKDASFTLTFPNASVVIPLLPLLLLLILLVPPRLELTLGRAAFGGSPQLSRRTNYAISCHYFVAKRRAPHLAIARLIA